MSLNDTLVQYNLTYYETLGELVSARWYSLLTFFVYWFLGALIVFFNMLVLLSVFRHPALRMRKESVFMKKECATKAIRYRYIMIASLAVADTLNGIGYVFAGFYRSTLILQQVDQVPDRTAWQCMWTAHNFFFVLGVPASGILLTAVNVDRFIAVAWPLVSTTEFFSLKARLFTGLLQIHIHVQSYAHRAFLRHCDC